MTNDEKMNGAESLVESLLASDVDICFTNPGTSEMHFVAALDKIPGMRCVLCLFEGGVTGAADGYYRMTGKPASTLLHLAPGLANGLANLHNAKKAHSGVVNIVGDHATYHLKYDAPLTADIEGVAGPMSHWVKTSPTSGTVAADGALAVEAARQSPGQIATLILPADTAWGDAHEVVTAKAPADKPRVSAETIKKTADLLRSGKTTSLLLGGDALTEECLELAGRIVTKSGCGIYIDWFNTRLQRGAGRVQVERIPYVVDNALKVLEAAGDMVLIGAKAPVAFFAYPDKPSALMPENSACHDFAIVGDDMEAALQALAEELDAFASAPANVAEPYNPPMPTGTCSKEGIAAVLANMIPENAIVIDESVTTGREFMRATAGAKPHDWLNNRGGSIGFGLPLAVGASIACPDRKVIALEGDGSAMYTIQSLWTMAREKLDVTILVFANGTYNILRGELTNVGVQNPGPRAIDMLSINRPDLDWVKMANGMGVDAQKVTTHEALAEAFKAGLDHQGPYLIEVVV
jgi:acetolactate synthase I/II/III large subunit